jgi:NAD(P)-dependent dehydrogenase (short-subunit alcohol dehydrogenase family)
MIVTGGSSGIGAATARATTAAGVFTTTPQILTDCREPANSHREIPGRASAACWRLARPRRGAATMTRLQVVPG